MGASASKNSPWPSYHPDSPRPNFTTGNNGGGEIHLALAIYGVWENDYSNMAKLVWGEGGNIFWAPTKAVAFFECACCGGVRTQGPCASFSRPREGDRLLALLDVHVDCDLSLMDVTKATQRSIDSGVTSFVASNENLCADPLYNHVKRIWMVGSDVTGTPWSMTLPITEGGVVDLRPFRRTGSTTAETEELTPIDTEVVLPADISRHTSVAETSEMNNTDTENNYTRVVGFNQEISSSASAVTPLHSHVHTLLSSPHNAEEALTALEAAVTAGTIDAVTLVATLASVTKEIAAKTNHVRRTPRTTIGQTPNLSTQVTQSFNIVNLVRGLSPMLARLIPIQAIEHEVSQLVAKISVETTLTRNTHLQVRLAGLDTPIQLHFEDDKRVI